MRYFPIFCDMRGRTVFIAGGGGVAANKVRLFAKTEAAIRVVAMAVTDEIAELGARARIRIEQADPLQADFGDALMVVAATESDADDAIAARATAEGYLVNAVDKTELCTFITPSIVDRGKVVVAIGTEGAAPVLARRTRERIEALLPERLGDLADFIGAHRERLRERLPATPERRAFWEAVVDGPIAAALLSGRRDEAARALEASLAALGAGQGQLRRGALRVVVSPPQDDLLTLRDLRVLQDADAVYHAEGVPAAVLDKVRRDAERFAVCGDARRLAEEIEVEAAEKGLLCVLILPPEPVHSP